MVNLRSYLQVLGALYWLKPPCRALSPELFMKFQWRIRDKRLRTKPENQLSFFQILVDLISKRRIFRAQIQLADLCSFPCPEVFSGTFKPGSHCAEIQKLVYKAQKPPRRKLLCPSLLPKPCGAPLVAFQQTQLPKPSLQAQRDISFT